MHARKSSSGKWTVEAYAGYDPKTKRKYRKTFTGKNLRDLKYKASLWEDEHHFAFTSESVGGCIDRYISKAERFLSPSTIQGYLAMRRRLPTWLVRLPADALSPAHIERFVSETDVSPKTIKNRLGLVTAALKDVGIKIPHARLPKAELPDLNIPDTDTVKKTLEAVKDDTELWICVMLAATGPLRAGEIAALSIDDIDGNTIHVCHDVVYGPDHKWHIKEPKTKKSNRYVDMSPDVISAIRRQGYVTNWTPKGIYNRFCTALRRAGIPHYRFHDLRHFCISELLAAGINEIYVSERSGHVDHATMQRYIHALGNRRRKVSEQIVNHFTESFR